jgi:hypothetical protein
VLFIRFVTRLLAGTVFVYSALQATKSINLNDESVQQKFELSQSLLFQRDHIDFSNSLNLVFFHNKYKYFAFYSILTSCSGKSQTV